MKTLVLTYAALITLASPIHGGDSNPITELNKDADFVIDYMKKEDIIKKHHLDPMPIGNTTVHLKLPFKEPYDIFMLKLRNGMLHQLSDFKRNGNCHFLYMDDMFQGHTVEVPILYPELKVNFDSIFVYLNGKRSNGTMEATIKDLNLRIFAHYKTVGPETLITGYDGAIYFDHGSVDVIFHGHMLTDWIKDIIVNSLIHIYHSVAMKDVIRLLGPVGKAIANVIPTPLASVRDMMH